MEFFLNCTDLTVLRHICKRKQSKTLKVQAKMFSFANVPQILSGLSDLYNFGKTRMGRELIDLERFSL